MRINLLLAIKRERTTLRSPNFVALVATLVAAIVSSGLGLTGLGAWHTHNTTLLRIIPWFAPLQYNSALAFLLCGTAFLAIACKWYRPGKPVAIASTLGWDWASIWRGTSLL